MGARVGAVASLLGCVLLGLSGCTKAWCSGPIEGQVIDEGTGAPLADAIVLVNWQIKGMEGYPQGQLAIFERVTDARGRFQIPAWGPKRPPPGTTVALSEPTVRVFKSGYDPLVVVREANTEDDSHARTLLMRRVEGAPAEYASRMSTFWTPLDVNLGGDRCDWRAAPRLFNALVQLRAEFDAAGVRSDLPLRSYWCTTDTH
ncbi:carboxypeptidase-like regulatory domain-containing protein [Peristeroidobacter soli]|uniref:carboxypeptidase-like regulatory domain-containing protein n=1 Tax=Peristeroidobacter soli TaxID=2497877 RepID=UPI00101DB682|nr:carboxypeptidase-like regulatory domain-containing protein [Peristeroidobacter soli]